MKFKGKLWLGLLAGVAALATADAPAPAAAHQPQKPNILFIMGDDIGWMQPSIYHRGQVRKTRTDSVTGYPCTEDACSGWT